MNERWAKCTVTSDSAGVPFHDRLKQLRIQKGLTTEDVASELDISLQEYEEYEDFAGELTMAASLADLRDIAKILEVPVRRIFSDDPQNDDRLSAETLAKRLTDYLSVNRLSIDLFEKRAGFEVREFLDAPATMAEWNLDCLRCVSSEIQVDWKTVLDSL